MKAITLYQPWATLLALGLKGPETRSWSTTFRGPLAIHASAKFTGEMQVLCWTEPFLSALKTWKSWRVPSSLPRGAVIGVCELVGCVQIRANRTLVVCGLPDHTAVAQTWVPPEGPQRCFGDYTPGRYAWILARPRLFREPIPAKGALGLWEWTPPENWESLLDGMEYRQFPE